MAALFTIAQRGKRPKCPSTDDRFSQGVAYTGSQTVFIH